MDKKLLIGIACLTIAGCHSTPVTTATEHTDSRLDEIEAECKADNKGTNSDCDVHTLAEKVGLICKTMPVTGSRIGVRTCTTAEQREQTTDEAKALAKEYQRQPFRHKTAETFMHDTNGS
ncbi:hypothetical protein [Lacimicrobium alkaliphilum]|uniref:Lipoprotein n=1 Tax=Lacimicrobium alkaliphilum TaxID=1526571 RepID=A0ABQ1RF12_9ALTE|nr:hypothetical protein [Lacimicrobium alkaliphilum]GGD66227.1 hypothetical protein GCM10011357_21830 [Lacimicrobium alkaliphilum]